MGVSASSLTDERCLRDKHSPRCTCTLSIVFYSKISVDMGSICTESSKRREDHTVPQQSIANLDRLEEFGDRTHSENKKTRKWKDSLLTFCSRLNCFFYSCCQIAIENCVQL